MASTPNPYRFLHARDPRGPRGAISDIDITSYFASGPLESAAKALRDEGFSDQEVAELTKAELWHRHRGDGWGEFLGNSLLNNVFATTQTVNNEVLSLVTKNSLGDPVGDYLAGYQGTDPLRDRFRRRTV